MMDPGVILLRVGWSVKFTRTHALHFLSKRSEFVAKKRISLDF